jgi:hypothetical protein
MPKFLTSQTDYSSGRLGKTYKGKWNFKPYVQGAEEINNMLVNKNGGLRKLQGEVFIDDLSFRIAAAGIVSPFAIKSFSTIINNKSIVVFAVFHNLGLSVALNLFHYFNEAFLVQVPIGTISSNVEDANCCFTTLESSYYMTFGSGSTAPIKIDIDTSGPTYTPSFAAGFLDFFLGHAFSAPNLDSNKSVTIAGADDGALGVTLTFNGAIDIPSPPFRIAIGGVWGGGTLESGLNIFVVGSLVAGTTYNASALYNDSASNTFPDNGSYTEFHIEAFGFGINEWPKICSSSDGRLILANTPSKPASFWGSYVGNPSIFASVKPFIVSGTNYIESGFSGDLVDTDPYAFTIASSEGADIEWIRANKELAIGASSNMFLARSFEGIISPLNIDIKPFSAFGTSGESAALTDAIYFTSNNDTSLVRFSYSSQNQSYSSQDVSILSPDWFVDVSFKRIVSDKINKCLLALNQDNEIYLLVDEPSAGLLAFSKKTSIPGLIINTITYAENEGKVYGVAEIDGNYSVFTIDLSPSTTLLDYMRYRGILVVLAGTTTIQTEFIGAEFDGQEIYYVESTSDLTDPSSFQTSTLNAAGEFTIPATAGPLSVIYGLPNEALVRSLPIQGGNQWGSTDMSIKRIDAVQTRLIDSYSCKVQVTNSSLEEEIVVTDTYSLGDGRFRVTVDGSSEEDIIIDISNDKIEPLTITSTTYRGVANDG